MIVYANIGSNIGDRRENISRAVADIVNEPYVKKGSVVVSDVIETDSWGYSSGNKFLNIGLKFEVSDSMLPEFLLSSLQKIEARYSFSTPHRNKLSGEYLDRILDIDIIAIDDILLDTPTLKLPHPHMHERLFVLEPMKQLNAEWRHPAFNITVTELIDQLINSSSRRSL